MVSFGRGLPVRKRELVIAPQGADGKHVIKNRLTGEYFRVSENTCFLLDHLNGQETPKQIESAFADKFGEELTAEELDQFLQMAIAHGFVEQRKPGQATEGSPGEANAKAASIESPPAATPAIPNQPAPPEEPAAPAARSCPRQSLLAWRKTLVDPDAFLTTIEPALRWVWTPVFVFASACGIITALVTLGLNAQEFTSSFVDEGVWVTAAIVILALLCVTMLHELAHGLTCKHFGGEVHEMGFLLLFFMPSFFANVSDAWLIPQKSRRLWITFAGGYFELCLWALAVAVWRLTLQDTLINYVALMVVSISGVRVLFNFNPFLKLDGYYLLADSLEICNLRQVALERLMGNLRWLFWGGPKPAAHPRAFLLLIYGATCWIFSIVFMGMMLYKMTHYLAEHVGAPGAFAGALVAVVALPRLFQGIFGDDAQKMLVTSPKRTAFWLGSAAALGLTLFGVKIDERSSGKFEIRPTERAEVRAPLAGFLREIKLEQGQEVSRRTTIARLEVPDLDSRIAQKRAELQETGAKLQLLQAGTREEELMEQQKRVHRAESWVGLAAEDLRRSEIAFDEDMSRFSSKMEQAVGEARAAKDTLKRAKAVYEKKVITEQQYLELERRYDNAVLTYQQVKSEKAALQSVGTSKAEQELARRRKELDDCRGEFELLQAGTRKEDVEAEAARGARIKEELNYLEGLQAKLDVSSDVAGVVITPHMHEKTGQYLREGDLICEVEDCSQVEFEISLPEQEARNVQPGQLVELKARALPYTKFEAEVERVAPAAESGTLQSNVVVYCRLSDPSGKLKAGMTGYARIHSSRASLIKVLADDLLKYVRTEFWW